MAVDYWISSLIKVRKSIIIELATATDKEEAEVMAIIMWGLALMEPQITVKEMFSLVLAAG